MDDTAALHRLLDEHAIKKVLTTYPRGIDREDAEFMAAIYHEDALDYHGSIAGLGKVFATNHVRRFWERGNPVVANASCGHFLGNITIEFASDDVAYTETYVRAIVSQENDGEWSLNQFFGRYLDRFERRDGEWKIAHRVTVRDFMCNSPVTPIMPDRPFQGTRDKNDPSYAHFRFEDLPIETGTDGIYGHDKSVGMS